MYKIIPITNKAPIIEKVIINIFSLLFVFPLSSFGFKMHVYSPSTTVPFGQLLTQFFPNPVALTKYLY